jgi:biotin synthase
MVGDLPSTIRVSIGSAIHLGLAKGAMDAAPTTAYLLSHISGKCFANCAFCAQARESSSRADMLSRVTWPPFRTEKVIKALTATHGKRELRRVCIQTVNHPSVFQETLATVKAIRSSVSIPISVSCMPFSRREMEQLSEAGVERLGIPLDAATEELFDRIKGSSASGPYRWRDHLRALTEAVEVFGRDRVSTHLMVGLGEKDFDLLKTVQTMRNGGVYPALFSFTPVPGSRLQGAPQPDIHRYRRIQLARGLIMEGVSTVEAMLFGSDGELVSFGVGDGELRRFAGTCRPFLTSGCPGCNRPYYNERPGGKIYNYAVQPDAGQRESIVKEALGEK